MSNNPLLFNAALAGATGGITSERWIVSTNAADYTSLRTEIVQFATALDAAIPTDATTNSQDAELLFSICQQIIAGKGKPGEVTALAQSIATFYSVMQPQLLAVGGGSDVPLTSVLFCDADTTVTLADQTGAIGTPFATITQAMAAATGIQNYTLELAPGGYAETLDGNGRVLTLVGMAAPQTNLTSVQLGFEHDITNFEALLFQNCNVENCNINVTDVEFYSCNIQSSGGTFLIECTFLFARDSKFNGGITIIGTEEGEISIVDSEIDIIEDGFTVVLQGSAASGSIQAVSLFLQESGVSGGITAETLTALRSALTGVDGVSCTNGSFVNCTPPMQTLTAVADVSLTASGVNNTLTSSGAVLRDCFMDAAVTTTANLEVIGGSLNNTVTVGGDCSINNCIVRNNVTVTGTLSIDTASHQRAVNLGVNFTVGTLVINDTP
jgi:hypothetical protein